MLASGHRGSSPVLALQTNRFSGQLWATTADARAGWLTACQRSSNDPFVVVERQANWASTRCIRAVASAASATRVRRCRLPDSISSMAFESAIPTDHPLVHLEGVAAEERMVVAAARGRVRDRASRGHVPAGTVDLRIRDDQIEAMFTKQCQSIVQQERQRNDALVHLGPGPAHPQRDRSATASRVVTQSSQKSWGPRMERCVSPYFRSGSTDHAA
jgi:hypothetical protein